MFRGHSIIHIISLVLLQYCTYRLLAVTLMKSDQFWLLAECSSFWLFWDL